MVTVPLLFMCMKRTIAMGVEHVLALSFHQSHTFHHLAENSLHSLEVPTDRALIRIGSLP